MIPYLCVTCVLAQALDNRSDIIKVLRANKQQMTMQTLAVVHKAMASLLLAGSVSNSSSTLCLGSSCYVLDAVKRTPTSAHSQCVSVGGSLWLPESSTQALAVESWFGLLNNRGGIWLGLSRTSSSGPWTPMDGSTLSYTHWCVMQPADCKARS